MDRERWTSNMTANVALWAAIIMVVFVAGLGFGLNLRDKDSQQPYEVTPEYVTFEIKYATIISSEDGKFLMKAEEVKEKKRYEDKSDQ